MRRLKYMILLIFVFISGCWDRMEMNDLAFVTGTAMDLSDDGNMLLCSLQIATPSTEGGMGGGSGSKDKFFVISAEGKNGNEIHQKLQKKSSRILFYSHRSVVFISERLAKHGIQGVLDIFTHDPRNRLKTYIMVVKGEEGKNILQMNYPLKQVPIEAVREMENSGDDLAVTLKDFFISSESEGVHPVVGVIESDIHSKSPHKQLFRLAGAGVFKDLKLSGLLDINEPRCVSAHILDIALVDQAADAAHELAPGDRRVVAVGNADDAQASVLEAANDRLLFDKISRQAIERFDQQDVNATSLNRLEQASSACSLIDQGLTGGFEIAEIFADDPTWRPMPARRQIRA